MIVQKVLSVLGLSGKDQESLLESFQKHYIETEGFIRSYIYWMVRSEVANDLVQETYLKGWKSFERFQNNSSFKTWIYKIATNVTYDFLKKNKQFKTFEDTMKSPEDNQYEYRDMISRGLLLLTVKEREVFILFFKFEYTVPEISKLIEIPEGTAKSRIHSGRDKFVNFLNKNGIKNE